MKFLLIAAFVALAVAGGCTELVNADFADDNTVEPWLTVSYNRGSDFCRRWNTPNNPETCALLQQNAFNGRDNAGRISVGSNERPACRYEDEAMQGMNVYQTNIGMCEGYRVTARIGTQDNRFAGGQDTRVPVRFALVVGKTTYDLMNGPGAEVPGSVYTFPALTEAPFNSLQEATIGGNWNSACGTGACPKEDCYNVGIRISRAAPVHRQIRNYVDDLELTDITPPVVSFSGQTATNTACGADVVFTFDATATDNCCETPSIQYWRDGAPLSGNTASIPVATWNDGTKSEVCTQITARATDSAGLTTDVVRDFCVRNLPAKMSCSGLNVFDTQSCWTDVPANNEGTPFATVVNSCGSYPIEYSADGTTTNDVTDFNFRNGKNAVEACVVSDTYSNAQDASPTNKDCCSFYIGFNLCCEWTYTTGDKKRSAAPLRKLAKF